MKKLLFSLIFMGLAWNSVYADEIYDAAPKATAMTREQKEEQKIKEKRLKEMTDSADYKLACAALRKGMFVLMATHVDLGNAGYAEYGLDENTNFVYQQGKEGVAQLAFNNGSLGLNGFGGVTCKGVVSGEKFVIDKKGNANYDFTITGNGITLLVNVMLRAGSKRAQARVEPVFGGSWSAVTLYGDIVPYKKD